MRCHFLFSQRVECGGSFLILMGEFKSCRSSVVVLSVRLSDGVSVLVGRVLIFQNCGG